jgi:signal transduction histidine kinase
MDAAALQERLRGLLRFRDEERARIASRLHDTTAQNLAATRLQLLLLQRSAAAGDPVLAEALNELIALTDQSIAEIRTLSHALHSPLPDEQD